MVVEWQSRLVVTRLWQCVARATHPPRWHRFGLAMASSTRHSSERQSIPRNTKCVRSMPLLAIAVMHSSVSETHEATFREVSN